MKKLSLLVLLLIMGIVLAACNSDEETNATNGSDDSEVSGEITVWVHPYSGDTEVEEAMWDEIIASYEEEFNATVKIEIIPWANRDQKVLTALAANNGPDVFYAIPDQMPQYAEEGMLLELDPYLEDNEMDDFVDTALASTTWKDKTYGIPILQSAVTYFYNVDVIEAIGEDPENLPTTWSEFDEWAEKAKDEGMYAMSFPGGGSMNLTLYPLIWQAGGDVVSEEDEVLINNPESVEAFEYVKKMYDNGWIPEDSVTAMEHDALFYGGEVLAIQGSGASINNLQENDMNFVIAPPLKNKEQATYGTTGMFVVPSNSDNPNAAAEFIKVVTNTENQRKFNSVTQFIPTRETAKDIYDDNEYLSQVASYTQYALSGVLHPKGRSIMPKIQAEMQTMLAGEKTPQEAADSAAEAIEAELN